MTSRTSLSIAPRRVGAPIPQAASASAQGCAEVSARRLLDVVRRILHRVQRLGQGLQGIWQPGNTYTNQLQLYYVVLRRPARASTMGKEELAPCGRGEDYEGISQSNEKPQSTTLQASKRLPLRSELLQGS